MRRGRKLLKWEPIENLYDAMELVTAFMAKRKQNPKGDVV